MKTNRRAARAGKLSADLLIVGGLILGFIALQSWVLPKMGVGT